MGDGMWKRSLKQTISSYEMEPRVKRFTWHLESRIRHNEAMCHTGIKLGGEAMQSPPTDGNNRLCMKCDVQHRPDEQSGKAD